jgi:TRAP-type C4-dicarboxylate transport system substrate-binding protein
MDPHVWSFSAIRAGLEGPKEGTDLKTRCASWLRPLVCGAGFLAIIFQGPSNLLAKEPRYLIKFATVAPDGSTWMKKMRDYDREIREKSAGEIGFRFYPGGVAGDELDILKKMRIGQIHCAAFSGVGLGQILPMVRVFDLPFLFRNDQESDLVHHDMFSFFSKRFDEKGFDLMAWAEVGNVYMFSKRPIQKVSDFSGLKVWTWSGDPIAAETFATLGVNPIPLAITDVTTALSTGMVDTVYGPILGALALQWHNYVKYMSALPFGHSTGAVLISNNYFNKIDDKYKAMLNDSFGPAMVGLTTALRGQTREALKTIQDAGLTITPSPSGAALEAFYEVHAKVAAKLTDTLYPKSVLDAVYRILNRSN